MVLRPLYDVQDRPEDGGEQVPLLPALLLHALPPVHDVEGQDAREVRDRGLLMRRLHAVLLLRRLRQLPDGQRARRPGGQGLTSHYKSKIN